MTKEKLSMVCWNINQRAGSHGTQQEIPEWIVDEVVSLEPKPHIIVLTEFFKAQNWLSIIKGLGEYTVFVTDNSIANQNDVLIAVKKDLRSRQIQDMQSARENSCPNFLQVDIELDSQTIISIVGVRIRIGSYGKKPIREMFRSEHSYREACSKWKQKSIDDKLWRSKQNEVILTHVQQLHHPVVITGDFNNFRRGYATDTWCLKVLQEVYRKSGFTLHEVEGGSIYQENASKSYQFAEDHIITKGLSVTDQRYSREFAVKKGREDSYPHGKDFRGVRVPFPDHAMLLAGISLPETKETTD